MVAGWGSGMGGGVGASVAWKPRAPELPRPPLSRPLCSRHTYFSVAASPLQCCWVATGDHESVNGEKAGDKTT